MLAVAERIVRELIAASTQHVDGYRVLMNNDLHSGALEPAHHPQIHVMAGCALGWTPT